MARPKTKDVRYMNVSLDRRFYEKFSDFCEKCGMSKTGATEKALLVATTETQACMNTCFAVPTDFKFLL